MQLFHGKDFLLSKKQATRNVKFNAHDDPLLGTLKILNIEDTIHKMSHTLQNLSRAFL